MTNKTLEFTLAVEVDESILQQVKDAFVGAEAEHPSLAETLVGLVKAKLSEMGVADDVTVKLDYRQTISRRPVLRGGLNPQEWLDMAEQDDQSRLGHQSRRLGFRD